MQHRATLNVVARGRLVVMHLLAPKDEPLLWRRDPLLLLNSLLRARMGG